MAESPSAGYELQDENGKKAFQLFKNSGYPSLSHACTVNNNVFVFVNSFRCTSSGGYVRTNSTSKQVTRGCVTWTIVGTIDKNVSHKTKDKVRICSTGNISLSVLTLGHFIYYRHPPPPLLGYFLFYPLRKVNFLPLEKGRSNCRHTSPFHNLLKDQRSQQLPPRKRPLKTLPPTSDFLVPQ